MEFPWELENLLHTTGPYEDNGIHTLCLSAGILDDFVYKKDKKDQKRETT